MGSRHAAAQQQEASQEERISDLESQQPPAPPAPAPAAAPAEPTSSGISSEAVQKLQELGKLHEQGILTDEEFSTAKAQILGI
jgi:hypothetical protein